MNIPTPTLLSRFTEPPSAHVVATRRLREAERELLMAELNARRAQHDVACLKDMVAHLRKLVEEGRNSEVNA